MNTTQQTPTLAEIEKYTKDYADARQALADQVTKLEAAVDRYKRRKLPVIKRLVAKTAEREAALKAMVENAPGLFVRPRTVIFHGIKVGFQKGKGSIDWDDNERVAQLIKKHLPEQYDTLVRTTHKPVNAALKNLSVAELKKIGCIVEETEDQVVIKAVDSDVDKVVAALLKNATESEVSQ